MGRYQVEKRVYEDVDLADSEVLTLQQAAKLLGRSVWAIADRVDRGALTAVINPEAPPRQGRRLLLRSEIEALLREREAGQGNEGDREAAGRGE